MIKRIKRSEFVFYYHKNGQIFDILEMLKGNIKFHETEQLLAFPILYGQEVIIDYDDFLILKEISTAKWVEDFSRFNLSDPFLKKFIATGILLVDIEEEKAQYFISKEKILNDQKWNIYAAFFHFLTKWKNVDVQLKPEDYQGTENIDLYHHSMDAVIERFGKPPTHFHSINIESKIDLPIVNKSDDPYYEVVLSRKTGRVYDRNQELPIEKLSTILYYTWGCHGIYEMHPALKMLHKTVPSGGSLHPTECYVLVINVEDLQPGIYHYNVETHSLCLVKAYDRQTAEDHANSFIAGQNYVRDANALFLMTSRYFRNFWKYRQHTLAYKVTQLDAAHLSQMFYLNCAKENLSCFVTGAVNTLYVEQEIGIDGFEEGTTLVVGCGTELLHADKNLLEPEFHKYEIKR